MHLAPLVTFGLLLVVGVPVIVVICSVFHLVFEAPFLRRRDISAPRLMSGIGKLLSDRRGRVVFVRRQLRRR